MFTQPHNENLLNDVMKILGGGNKPENNIKPAPQWIIEASQEAAKELSQATLSESVMTSELKRDILRRHLSEAVKNCGCSVDKETPTLFQKEVEKRMSESIVPTAKLADPKTVAKKTAVPPSKGIAKNTGIGSKGAKMEAREQIAVDMREFLAHLNEEEIDVLSDVVLEATMSKKQLDKAVNAAFTKHFNKVQIDMLAIPRLYKEIEAGLSAGKDADTFMPELVKKYRKN